jgi:hypothetical protein
MLTTLCSFVPLLLQRSRPLQDWSEHFGFTIGVGAGKTEATFFSVQTVKAACDNDKNGMLDPQYRDDAEADAADPEEEGANPDDEHGTVLL